jgi:hypothetical protein
VAFVPILVFAGGYTSTVTKKVVGIVFVKSFCTYYRICFQTLKFTDDGFIEIGCFRNNNSITFYVEDSGIGIDSNKIDVIF